jgi:hypothetical protein
MLKKMFGVRLVFKLRAILLMEADFNAMNNKVYGVCMLDEARKYQLLRSWGRRAMAVAREVPRYDQTHPYSWLVTIVSLRGLELW